MGSSGPNSGGLQYTTTSTRLLQMDRWYMDELEHLRTSETMKTADNDVVRAVQYNLKVMAVIQTILDLMENSPDESIQELNVELRLKLAELRLTAEQTSTNTLSDHAKGTGVP